MRQIVYAPLPKRKSARYWPKPAPKSVIVHAENPARTNPGPKWRMNADGTRVLWEDKQAR